MTSLYEFTSQNKSTAASCVMKPKEICTSSRLTHPWAIPALSCKRLQGPPGLWKCWNQSTTELTGTDNHACSHSRFINQTYMCLQGEHAQRNTPQQPCHLHSHHHTVLVSGLLEEIRVPEGKKTNKKKQVYMLTSSGSLGLVQPAKHLPVP